MAFLSIAEFLQSSLTTVAGFSFASEDFIVAVTILGSVSNDSGHFVLTIFFNFSFSLSRCFTVKTSGQNNMFLSVDDSLFENSKSHLNGKILENLFDKLRILQSSFS